MRVPRDIDNSDARTVPDSKRARNLTGQIDYVVHGQGRSRVPLDWHGDFDDIQFLNHLDELPFNS